MPERGDATAVNYPAWTEYRKKNGLAHGERKRASIPIPKERCT
jgi:hypothetical protein